MYKGINRKQYGIKSENVRLDKLFDRHALRTSHATLLIASRASRIDDVNDRSAAKARITFSLFFI